MERGQIFVLESFSEINIRERGTVLEVESLNLVIRYVFNFNFTNISLRMPPILFQELSKFI